MIQATINHIPVTVPEGTSIFDAAQSIDTQIPTLCKHPDLPPTGACGICVVRIHNTGKMLRSCCTPLEQGMEIITHDPEIVQVRKNVIELILSAHPNNCLECGRNGNCELQTLAANFGIREIRFPTVIKNFPKDYSTGAIVLDPDKCVRCGRCLEVCQNMQNVWALSFLDRGIETRMSPAGDISLSESPCVRCGQCAAHCPTGAIFEQDDTRQVWEALLDPDRYCVAQIAPAVRVAIGEAFGLDPGNNSSGKLYAVLRRLGFKAVFDTSFGADVTIMEEASEFVHRLRNAPDRLPLITTCCPSWVDFMEKKHADMIPSFSSCKSPHEILGVLSKTYYARVNGIDPAKITMVSIMPCTSKKYETTRSEEMFASGYKDIDVVLTTREMARVIKQAGIDFSRLRDEPPDHILGTYSGAGVIFGATGGVMEAALRTAHFLITGRNLERMALRSVRGLDGVKETEVNIEGHRIRVAIAHGLSNVEEVINEVRSAKADQQEPPYHFIEVMACPGGCIGGGGQPYGITNEIRDARAHGIYQDDVTKQNLRCSHDNPYVKQLYKSFLGKPLGEMTQKLLHTTYQARAEYVK